MKGIGKATLAGAAVAGLLAVGVGAAFAAGGPPRLGAAPQLGMQAGAGYGVMAGGVVVDAAAGYVGISQAALAAERHDGTSLAQIATEHGKTVAGLQTALVNAFQANLDRAVAAGRLTDAQAAQALASFKVQVSTLVQRTDTGPLGGRGGGMGAGGHCRWAP